MGFANKHEQALAVYNGLCANLDAHNFHCERDEEKLTIEGTAQGEDFPIDIDISVDEDRQLVILLSHQPMVVPEDKRLDMAVAVSVVNNMLVDGCFDFDISNGHMFFRMVSSFRDSLVGDELFTYMMAVSLRTIDKFNDKFFVLSKGMLTLEEFIKRIRNN